MNRLRIRLHKFLKLEKNWLIALATMGLLFSLAASARAANDDFMIVLDQSGSMREKVPGDPKGGYETDPFKARKSKGAIDALNGIAKDLLKADDYFTLITFGDKAEVVFSQLLSFPHEREVLQRKSDTLLFKDQKTDILAGLKKATDVLAAMNTPQRRKILVMITDGMNEPPADSPYLTPEAQEKAFQELRETIKQHNWDIALVGLGVATNIADIAQKLNLPPNNAIVMNQLQNSSEITGKLKGIVGELQAARVELQTTELRLRLQPKLLGGYAGGQATLALKSFYNKDIEVQLDPQTPLQHDGSDSLKMAVTPSQLKFAAQQAASFQLAFAFTGKRPADGRLSGKFIFRFTAASTQFFPHEGRFEIILPGWWEVYGLFAAAAMVLAVLVLGIIIWAVRRAQVPEIRIAVTANYNALGEPLTLRTKETFTIANGDFGGKTVSAKGLTCKTAASVTYVGRRKFEIKAVEAKLIVDGKTVDRLQVKLEQLFELEDSAGKKLRSIMITTPGKGGSDPFGGGGSSGDSPF